MNLKHKILITVLAAVVALAAFSAHAAEYTLDKAHTEVGFQVTHLTISKVNGKFDDFTGTFNFVPDDPSKWSCAVTIQATSINTGNEKRDEHLRSSDFFDAAKFTAITFKSSVVVMTDQTHGTMTGELTMHGVTMPVALDVEFLGSVIDLWGHKKVGFSLSGTLKRSDWGLKWNKTLETGGLMVSDKVKLMINVEGNKVE